jgi:hypothetical protein
MISKAKKELLCKFHDNICENCKKKFPTNELHIHRINRGYLGGSYEDHRNLKVLCEACHKLVHWGEFDGK